MARSVNKRFPTARPPSAAVLSVSPPCHPMDMTDQLALLPDTSGEHDGANRGLEPCWELDDHTRDVGRRGLAAARRALRQASARQAA